MLRYVARRGAHGVVTVLGVLLLLFALFFLVTTPDDAARKALGDKASPAALTLWKTNHGYDKPYFWNPRQPAETILVEHFRRMLTFDFGRSDADDTPIADRLRAGVGPSLTLSAPLFVLGLVFSIGLALLVALLRETPFDRAVVIFCVLTMSVSTLLYIVGAQFLLGKVLRWFPISGFDPDLALLPRFLAMPLLVGLLAGTGRDVRFYRTVFLDEITRDYVRTARAKGCPPGLILRRHVLRNALIPILTRVALAIPFLFTGSILLESFFGIPGLGSITVDAINGNDFATLRVMVFIGSLLFVAAQILADIAYTLVDPRVHIE